MAKQKNDFEDTEDTKYFKSPIHGLEVVIGNPDPTKGEVAPKVQRFEPYWLELRGVEGKQKIGYLKTDNGSVLKKLDGDSNVTEISADEFYEATEPTLDASGVQIGGFKAPR